jgi:hypothetical protein
MRRLKIPTRENINLKNDSLPMKVGDTILHFTAGLYYGKINIPFINGGLDTGKRTYINPTMHLSNQLGSIFFKKVDTSRRAFISAVGSIIHELYTIFNTLL